MADFRLLEDGTSKRLLENGTDFRILEGGAAADPIIVGLHRIGVGVVAITAAGMNGVLQS